MVVQRFMIAVAAAMMLAAPAALAQSLPAGGVLVEATNGLQLAMHSHPHLCQQSPRYHGAQCLLRPGEWALLHFSFKGNNAQGCVIRVSQSGDPPRRPDHFVLAPERDRQFRGHCGVHAKTGQIFEIYPLGHR